MFLFLVNLFGIGFLLNFVWEIAGYLCIVKWVWGFAPITRSF